MLQRETSVGPQGSLVAGFMFEKIKTKTLWIIAIASGISFVLSPFIATPIGTLADKILLSRFAEQWSQTHDPSLAWQSMALGDNIFAFTTYLIASVALVVGLIAARALYKRRNI